MAVTSQETASDSKHDLLLIPENFVFHTMEYLEVFPPLIAWRPWYKEMQWLQVTILTLPPVIGIIGAWYTPLCMKTAIWTWVHISLTGFGLGAGYHRLWSHRAYNATRTLEYILAVLGAAAVQGPISWWAGRHRAHHRYTDTDLDPYNSRNGLLYSHIGWMIFKPRQKHGPTDLSDLRSNPVVVWQRKYYFLLAFVTAIVVPVCVAGLGWGDWKGGFVWASMLRLVYVHHSTFCVNSLCHWIGEQPYDDKQSPRDHFITAFLSMGEGYHNFHHQFPMDYRNGYRWYQYDPSKWFVWVCEKVGLATHLKTFSDNEIKKGQLTMRLRRLREKQDALTWPSEKSDLPVITWEDYQQQAESRALICIAGCIHDVGDFFDKHPGGTLVLKHNIGKDATAAFFGGIYDHSNAAHNLLAMKRVAILLGGTPHVSEEQAVPPSQRLRVARHDEIAV